MLCSVSGSQQASGLLKYLHGNIAVQMNLDHTDEQIVPLRRTREQNAELPEGITSVI